MNAVIAAIEAAADRGVHVRLLVEKVFRDKYPESVERLGKRMRKGTTSSPAAT